VPGRSALNTVETNLLFGPKTGGISGYKALISTSIIAISTLVEYVDMLIKVSSTTAITQEQLWELA